jgi:hypothetical protein
MVGEGSKARSDEQGQQACRATLDTTQVIVLANVPSVTAAGGAGDSAASVTQAAAVPACDREVGISLPRSLPIS